MALTMTANERLTAKIAGLSDDQLMLGIVTIGEHDRITPDQRMVRARLLAEYERREGVDAVDVLMTLIGL